MSVLTSVGILLLSMLIMAFLQLSPGIFSLLIHYTNGKFSKNKASDLCTFFILGVETAVVLFFLTIYSILASSPAIAQILDSDLFAWIMFSIFVALGCFVFFFYFRPGPGTKLFISRKLAHEYSHRAETAKTRSDAFVLGLSASVPELAFSLPLYLITATAIMRTFSDGSERTSLIILFVLVVVLPLLILHGAANTGRTLADFARFRFKNKTFFRCFIALFYFLLAFLVISEAIL